jgi:hypothetical protein
MPNKALQLTCSLRGHAVKLRCFSDASRSPDMNWGQSGIVFAASPMTQAVLLKLHSAP